MSAFRGRVAVVTGGASGIGRALCAALAGRGATVILTDRNAEGVAAAVRALREAASAGGGALEGEALDVTDAVRFREVVAAAHARHGRIDLLFLNAGLGQAGEVRDLELDHWRRLIDVNLWGVIHGIAAAYPAMVERGTGHIVITASGAGLVPRPGMTPYAATKHAVVGLATSLRAEGAALGVRVTAVCPGYIATAIGTPASMVNLDGEALRAKIPIRAISAEVCAERVLDGVARNRPFVIVGFHVWLDWWLSRMSPGLAIRVSEWRARQFRAHRLSG